ncbi:MAG TPA: outer-membrane lipoprotein carrier protein LolA [Asticcacaulis sp.]|nr:outer-membrane lipoprotein carrier protein LolA [Asticcacaulis sp.]
MPASRRALVFSLMALAATPALAAGKNDFDIYVRAPDFNAADKARIAKATAYLQNLGAANGRFEQTDFRNRVTQGNWYLSRPGKMRFEYDPPSSLLIVSDGNQVKMWDPRLQSLDSYPLSETPLSLFLARQIRFDLGVIVTQVTSNANGFTLKARDRRKQVEGFVMLGFNQAPDGSVSLREWTVVDQQGRPTTVKLVSFQRDSVAKADLFVLNKSQAKK